jgi:hypothetical protein
MANSNKRHKKFLCPGNRYRSGGARGGANLDLKRKTHNYSIVYGISGGVRDF